MENNYKVYEELLTWEKKRVRITKVLIVAMILLAVVSYVQGFSPCEKCKLKIWEKTPMGVKPNLYKEVTALDLMRNWSIHCITLQENKTGVDTSLTLEQLNKLLNKS